MSTHDIFEYRKRFRETGSDVEVECQEDTNDNALTAKKQDVIQELAPNDPDVLAIEPTQQPVIEDPDELVEISKQVSLDGFPFAREFILIPPPPLKVPLPPALFPFYDRRD